MERLFTEGTREERLKAAFDHLPKDPDAIALYLYGQGCIRTSDHAESVDSIDLYLERAANVEAEYEECAPHVQEFFRGHYAFLYADETPVADDSIDEEPSVDERPAKLSEVIQGLTDWLVANGDCDAEDFDEVCVGGTYYSIQEA